MTGKHSRRWRIVAGIVFTAAAAVACGDNKQPASPSAPSATSPASPSSGAGATIAGTVIGGVTSASALITHATNLTVTITGTSTTATVDGSGRFVLQNVPAGHVDLHFTGPGIDAHLALDNVANNASITITVRVSGTTAQLDNDDRQNPNNEVEVEGLVTSKSAATITVNGRMIEISAATQIVHGDTKLTLAQIGLGDRVHVKGTPSGTLPTSVAATKIEVQNQAGPGPANPGHDNDDNDDDHNNPPTTPGAKAEIEGSIVTLSGACPNLTFKINTTTVKTNASTKFDDTSCTALKAGNKVEVKGTVQADKSILATQVEKG